jgi:hypothetical protein
MIVICDLDGTLCDHKHRKHLSHLDFDEYNGMLHLDVPKPSILAILNAMDMMLTPSSTMIYLMTGRPEQYREATVFWLSKHNVPYYRLIMRPTGNMESDVALKARMFSSEGMYVEDVLFVMEDMDCVVDMWRGLGLTCLQVEKFEPNKGQS